MLIVRDAQFEAVADALSNNFRSRALEHLRAVAPDVCDQFGAEKVRASIRVAIRQGKRYGLREEYDFLRYLNAMYALGFHFDADPRFSWAGRILLDSDIDGRTKMDRIVEHVREELRVREAL